MSTSLNSKGVSHARALVAKGAVDKTGDWSFSAADGNAMLGPKGDDWANYGKWFMAVHSDQPEKSKGHYGYPFGKNGKVYRSALVAIRVRASQNNEPGVFDAAGALLDKIDGKSVEPMELKDLAQRSTLGGTVYKASELSQTADGQYEFVASDESVDRMGDIIRVSGWELGNYKRNPIVLFQHQASNPVGISTKVWIDGKKLMSRIKLAAEGTSPFIDTLRKLLEQRIIRAVSVGFGVTKQPNYLRDESNDRITGLEFVGQELHEISLVSIPANANALAMAKSLHIPELHMQRVFERDKGASAQLVKQKAILELIKVR